MAIANAVTRGLRNLLRPINERMKTMDCAAFAASARLVIRQHQIAPQSGITGVGHVDHPFLAASRPWGRRCKAASRRTHEKMSLSVGREPSHSRATAYSTVTTAFTTFSTVLVS